MKAENVKLLRFLSSSQTLFSIPVYQRNYEWGTEQCKKLFFDLENNARNGQSHFLGTTVFVKEDGDNLTDIYNIIDGQQRITSCMLLLKAISNSSYCSHKEEIEDRIIFDKYADISDHLKLNSVSKDKEAFRMVMTDRVNDYDHPSKVVENFKIFKQLINKSEFSGDQLFNAMNYFDMVYISLDNGSKGENPQLVFESLNSTGISLTASDLIRNFILMQINNAEQTRLYNDYWSKIQNMFNSNVFTEFVRHYLTMKIGRFINKKDVYSTYKDYFKQNNLTSEEALKEMYRMATYYDNLLNAYNMPTIINEIVHNINILDKTIVYPYFLMLMDKQYNGESSWDDLKALLYLVESYFFRRMFCGIPSSGLNKVFIPLINNNKKQNMYSQLKQKLLNNNFPTDKEFKDSIINYPIYSSVGTHRNWVKLALAVIENHFTKETIDFDQAQVEHIMPQQLSSDWRIQVPNADAINDNYGNTLGNLTLTKYNQEMSNKSFEDKKKFYEKSNILITRNISSLYPIWNKNAITKRASKLANNLIKIFERPKLTDEEAYSDVYGEHPIEEDIDVTGKKIVKITISEKDYTASTWISALIIFLDYLWDKDSNNINLVKNNPSLNQRLFTDIRREKLLSNGEKIESNLSATTILALMSKIAAVCGITEEVRYTVK